MSITTTLHEDGVAEVVVDRPPVNALHVDGWFELHGRFGELSMKEVLAPAIGYAREGFPLSEVIAHYWESGVRSLAEYPGFAEQPETP